MADHPATETIRMRIRRAALTATLLLLAGCENTDVGLPSESSPATESQRAPQAADGAPRPEQSGVERNDPQREKSPLTSRIRFTDVTADSGIDFVHVSGDSDEKPFPAANGSGIAVIDLDRDGRQDLLFLNGTRFPVADPETNRSGPSDQCYRSLGDWKFANVTALTGLGFPGYSAGAAVGDWNSDGFPDIAINCFGPNELYLNQGDGTFSRCGAAAGLDDPAWGTSIAFLDYNNDALLDLYVCNYARWSLETNGWCGNREANVRIFCAPHSVKPVPDRLYENLGDGRFVDVLAEAGMNREPGRGQGVLVGDLDNDGLADVYVANDASPNFLFRNCGDGRFEDRTDISGASHDFQGRVQAGMGADLGDIDRNGTNELFVTNYEDEHNALYESRQPGFFQDVSRAAGLAAPSVRWVGWGTGLLDLDLDGWLDLVVTNGHTDNNLAAMGRDAPYEQPPLLFQNDAGRMQLVTSGAGDYFEHSHCGRSLAAADFDGDLLTDLVIGHQDQSPALLRNQSDRAGGVRVVRLLLTGTTSGRDGIGAVAEIAGASPVVRAEVKSGGSYLSSSARDVMLVTSSDQEIPVTIRWAAGQVDDMTLPMVSGAFVVLEGRGLYSVPSPQD